MKGIHARNIFGENLKRRRKALGQTQISFAESLGITQGALSQLESGTKGFNSDTITDIAAALKCEPWELLQPIGGAKEERGFLVSYSFPRLSKFRQALVLWATTFDRQYMQEYLELARKSTEAQSELSELQSQFSATSSQGE